VVVENKTSADEAGRSRWLSPGVAAQWRRPCRLKHVSINTVYQEILDSTYLAILTLANPGQCKFLPKDKPCASQ